MDYYILFSGLIGTVIGGILTWLITKESLKKQFEYQQKLIEMKEKQQRLVALKSIRNEITHNIIQLKGCLRIMKYENMHFLNYRRSQLNNNLKSNKWEKHNDILESFSNEDHFRCIKTFYMNLSVEISNQITSKERAERLIKQGLNAVKTIEKSLNSDN